MMRRVLYSFLLSTILLMGAQAQQIGKVRGIERQVQLQSATGFGQARLNQPFARDQKLRTLRRSKAILEFTDSSQLRVNERTELTLMPTQDLVRYKLTSGAIWLKVPKGLRIEIETPVMTAAVRGTEFELTATGELRVYQGEVAYTSPESNGSAGVNQIFDLQRGLKTIPEEERPKSHGGSTRRWWETIIMDRDAPASLEQDPVENRLLAQLLFPLKVDRAFITPTNSGPWKNDDLSGAASFAGLGAALLSGGPVSKPNLGGAMSFYGGETDLSIARLDASSTVGKAFAELTFEARSATAGAKDWETRIPSQSMFTFGNEQAVSYFSGRGMFTGSAVRIGAIDAGLLNNRQTAIGAKSQQGAFETTLARFTGESQATDFAGVAHYFSGVRANAYLGNTQGQTSTEFGLQIPLYQVGMEFYGSIGRVNARNVIGYGIDSVRDLTTLGFNLSGLFEQTGIDITFEHQSLKDYFSAYGVRLAAPLSDHSTLQGMYINRDKVSQWVFGINYRF